MTIEEKDKYKKWVKVAVVVGVVLGLLCSAFPQEYQKPCHLVANALASC